MSTPIACEKCVFGRGEHAGWCPRIKVLKAIAALAAQWNEVVNRAFRKGAD